MPNNPTSDFDHVRSIAEQHAGVPGTPLWVLAHNGLMPDRAATATEVRSCIAAIEARPHDYDDAHEELDRLYELATWVETHRIHFHLGHNSAGYLPEGEPTCVSDPAEAVEAFLAMVRGYADEHDATAEQLLLETAVNDDYLCFCGHDTTEHEDTQLPACLVENCECEGYEPDWGDDTPNTRVLVEAALADDPPRSGQDYSMSVAHSDGWRREFFLHVVIVEGDTATCETAAVLR